VKQGDCVERNNFYKYSCKKVIMKFLLFNDLPSGLKMLHKFKFSFRMSNFSKSLSSSYRVYGHTAVFGLFVIDVTT